MGDIPRVGLIHLRNEKRKHGSNRWCNSPVLQKLCEELCQLPESLRPLASAATSFFFPLSLWQTTYQYAEIFQLQPFCQQTPQPSLGKPRGGRRQRGGAARTGTPLPPQLSPEPPVPAELGTAAGLGSPSCGRPELAGLAPLPGCGAAPHPHRIFTKKKNQQKSTAREEFPTAKRPRSFPASPPRPVPQRLRLLIPRPPRHRHRHPRGSGSG